MAKKAGVFRAAVQILIHTHKKTSESAWVTLFALKRKGLGQQREQCGGREAKIRGSIKVNPMLLVLRLRQVCRYLGIMPSFFYFPKIL